MQRMSASHRSDELRQIGNANYRTALGARRVTEKRRFLWQAIDKYKEADRELPARCSTKARSQCYKNLGVANKELAVLEWKEGNSQRSWMHIHDCAENYACASLNCSSWAADASQSQWQQELMRQCANHLQQLCECVLHCETDKIFVKNLHILCQKLSSFRSDCPQFLEVAVAILVDLANRQLHLGITLHNSKQFIEASSYIAEMHFPIHEAARLSARDSQLASSYESELNTLRTDHRIQDSIFRSHIELETAKSFIQNLDHESNRWMDEALLASDHLRAALDGVSEEGLDIALEAEICSNLGTLHLKVLKSERTAKNLLNRTLQLVLCFLSDTPQHCRNETWFSAAERGLQEIQRRQAERQDEERIKELKEDGTLLKIKTNHEAGLDKFLEFIYKEFNFINRSAPSKDLEEKKRLIKALTHFHPDKVDKQNRRQYWICEEVTKYLNIEYFKRR